MNVITGIKDSTVSAKGMQPQLVLAIVIAGSVFAARGVPLLITSLNDGKHMDGSLHYAGMAFDLRLPSRYTGDAGTDSAILLALRGALGVQYDVILEHDHLHIEFDPKEAIA